MGAKRRIYLHPNDPDLLIKIARPEAVAFYRNRMLPWYRQSRRFRHLTPTLRELREQLALYAHSEAFPRYLQRFIGFIETDLGLGEVVELKRGADSLLAPTLKALILAGRFDEDAARSLKRFLSWLMESDVVVSDLHTENLVYAVDADGRRDFAMIDGLGETAFVPLKSLSRRLNRMHKKRRIRRLLVRIDRMVQAHGRNSADEKALRGTR